MVRFTRKIFFCSLRLPTYFFVFFLTTSLLFNGHQAEAAEEVKSAKTAATEVVQQPSIFSASVSTNDTLKQIIVVKQALKNKLSEEEKNFKREKTEAQQEIIRAEMQEITSRLQALDSDFESIVSGVDPAEFSVATENVDWQQELRDLLSPILEEMKKFTARPRELEALRKQIALYRKRISLTNGSVIFFLAVRYSYIQSSLS